MGTELVQQARAAAAPASGGSGGGGADGSNANGAAAAGGRRGEARPGSFLSLILPSIGKPVGPTGMRLDELWAANQAAGFILAGARLVGQCVCVSPAVAAAAAACSAASGFCCCCCPEAGPARSCGMPRPVPCRLRNHGKRAGVHSLLPGAEPGWVLATAGGRWGAPSRLQGRAAAPAGAGGWAGVCPAW